MIEPKDVQLIIVPDLDGGPESLRSSLMDQGYSTEVYETLKELEPNIRKHRNPILIGNCGSNEDAAVEFGKSLIDSPFLYGVPLLLIGSEAASFERVLQRSFKVVVALNTPFLRSECLSALEYLVSNYPTETKKPVASSSIERPSGAYGLEIPLAERDIRTLVFSQLSQLPKENFGGSGLKNTLTIKELDQLDLLPKKDVLSNEFERIVNTLPRWPRDHLLRVIYINDSFHRTLAVPDQVRLASRDACILLFSSFSSKNASLLERNYLLGKGELRKSLASVLKDSALRAVSEIRDAEAARIISLVARYIAKEEHPGDSMECLSASLLAASELLDRVCFELGYWNPRSAYTLIRAATEGKLNFIHPLAAACMMKFLSEALASLPKTFLIKQIAKSNPEFAQRALENEQYTPEGDEQKIPLDNLEPGMRLSKPIYSFDGRKILSGEIELDQDLIWRLWRLSSIRPMNTPLVVKKEQLN